ncbi:MAG: glycosyltransferase family 2 protein [Hyphomonadaceae bacterium]
MDAPLISVIIPYYSHGRHLHQTVHAALRAYSGPLEIIVVNDGSREPKARVYLEQVKQLSSSVKVIVKENGGLSSARNAGLEVAQGDFVQLLDSDDLLVPGKLDLQIQQFLLRPDTDIQISNYILCDEDGTVFTRDGDPISRFDFTLRDFLFRWERGFSIPIHCALFRRSAFDGLSFETGVVGKEDWIFWCMQAHAGRRFGYAPVYGAIYRQHQSGMSKSYRAMGDSWRTAARVINRAIDGAEPDFIAACEDWHASFYAPRIAAESRSRAQKAPEEKTNDTPAADNDLSWIDEIARQRHAPPDAPTFSVVVPVYNHYGYLRECLSSIALQSVDGGVEIVIADDCSPDPRVRGLLEQFAEKVPGVKLVLHDKNVGISENQNSAVRAASGRYIAFVDCDDAIKADALSIVAAKIRQTSDYLFTDREDVDEAGKLIRIAKYGGYDWIKPSRNIPADLLDGMVASHLKVIRRETYLGAGGSDPAFAGVQDWDLALKIAERKGSFVYVPEAVYRHRLHTQSVTRSDSVRQFWLSNLARRRSAHLQLKRPLSDDEAIKRARVVCGILAAGDRRIADPDVLVVRKLELPAQLIQLKSAWREGKICIYAPSPAASIPELNLCREFNSYFDAVYAAQEWIACFFLGYMWDHRALVFDGEIDAPASAPTRRSAASVR